jgi:two-component system phosphate regulon response regulator PhoB
MPPPERSRVLVADAEQSERNRVRESLAVSPVELLEAASVDEAISLLESTPLDLVITELQLPEASGYVLCRHMRERTGADYVPVIVVSTWKSESDRILAFECGADDFVAKPFFARELSSRVEAVLRRRRDQHDVDPDAAHGGQRVQAHPTTPNRRLREVLLDGEPLQLTPKERALLGALAQAGGRVLSRTDLIERVWDGAAAPTHRSVDSHIKSLRRKLAPATDCVETVRGVGYRFASDPRLELR